MQRRENIILIGFMGSGKSSIGKRVSKRLGFQFIDTDQIVIDRAGMPIADIFERLGEDKFRDLESSALRSIAHLNRCLVATGGGIVVRSENRALLRQLGYVICLTASEDVIFERVSRNSKRPLLHTPNPRQTLSALLTTRQPFYGETAQFILDTTKMPQAEAEDAIVDEARRAFSWHRAA